MLSGMASAAISRSVGARSRRYSSSFRRTEPLLLLPEARRLLKRNILDSLGCAIAALPGQPFKALREQFEEYRAAPGERRIARWPRRRSDPKH